MKAITVKTSDFDSLYSDLIAQDQAIIDIFHTSNTITIVFAPVAEYEAAITVKSIKKEKAPRKATTRKEQHARIAELIGGEVIADGKIFQVSDRIGNALFRGTLLGVQRFITKYQKEMEKERCKKVDRLLPCIDQVFNLNGKK